MIRSSSYGRRYVALPSSVCSRHTNPGLPSASALISSRRATKPAMTASSSGAFMRAMFTWARCIGAKHSTPAVSPIERQRLDVAHLLSASHAEVAIDLGGARNAADSQRLELTDEAGVVV